jgi:nucleotide-binding universal stress UspA family protein
MKKILVPCDFSKPAINALRVAVDIAARAKATVHLIHVIELPVLHDTVLMPVLNFEAALLEELKVKTEKQFIKIREKYKIEGVKIVSKLEFGAPSKAIIEYAHAQAIDLIIMGSHGASGLREFVIGSNAEKIVRKSPVPVLVIKDYFKGTVKNIVFPNSLDTEQQEDLVMKVKELQDFFKAKLHIVHINTPLNFSADDITYSRLKAFVNRYNLKNCTLNVYNHPDGEEGINQFTEKVKGDMIAIGTHGRKGIAHLVNGSLAEDVANHTNKPIWTYTLKNEPVGG